MNANLKFEIKAAAFQRMTGKLAPGKDEPAAASPTWESQGERLAAWVEWHKKYDQCFEAIVAAIDQIGLG